MKKFMKPLDNLLENQYFTGGIILFAIMYSSNIHPKLPDSVKSILDSVTFLIAFFTSIAYIAMKNPILALIVSMAFIMTSNAMIMKEGKETFNEVVETFQTGQQAGDEAEKTDSEGVGIDVVKNEFESVEDVSLSQVRKLCRAGNCPSCTMEELDRDTPAGPDDWTDPCQKMYKNMMNRDSVPTSMCRALDKCCECIGMDKSRDKLIDRAKLFCLPKMGGKGILPKTNLSQCAGK